VTDHFALTQAIEQVLPTGAVCAVSAVGTVDTSPFAEEQAAVARAISKRRREFCAGRMAARRALERLGRSAQAIPVGPDRAPIWPGGVVGAITHTDHVAAAVVAPAGLGGIGIDCELNGRVTPDLASRVSSGSDEQVAETDAILAQRGISADTVRFSAKESGFKAYHPATKHFLDFTEVQCRFAPIDDPTRLSGAFELVIRPQDAPPLAGSRRIPGAFILLDTLVITVAWAAQPHHRPSG